MTQNQIAYFSAKEQQRHNLAMEAETGRHNVVDEGIRHDTNSINATHYSVMDAETMRSNLAREAATREQLGISRAQVELGYASLNETTRHNRASEALSSATLAETATHNRVSESLIAQQNLETNRANVARETETMRLNNSTIATNFVNQDKTRADAAQSRAHTEYFGAQTEQARAETRYTNQQAAWYGLNQAANKVDSAIGNVSTLGNTVLKVFSPLRLLN